MGTRMNINPKTGGPVAQARFQASDPPVPPPVPPVPPIDPSDPVPIEEPPPPIPIPPEQEPPPFRASWQVRPHERSEWLMTTKIQMRYLTTRPHWWRWMGGRVVKA